jgi:hypothetical protein
VTARARCGRGWTCSARSPIGISCLKSNWENAMSGGFGLGKWKLPFCAWFGTSFGVQVKILGKIARLGERIWGEENLYQSTLGWNNRGLFVISVLLEVLCVKRRVSLLFPEYSSRVSTCCTLYPTVWINGHVTTLKKKYVAYHRPGWLFCSHSARSVFFFRQALSPYAGFERLPTRLRSRLDQRKFNIRPVYLPELTKASPS